MDERIKLGIIFGGRSGEHEVSLRSARSVLNVLDARKYAVTQIGITHDGAWLAGDNVLEALEQGKTSHLQPAAILPDPSRRGVYAFESSQRGELLQTVAGLDVVFPLVHGTYGEDGTLQGLLEMASVAYVGSGVLGSSVGMDKALFKDVMRTNKIPVVPSLTILRKEIERDIAQALQHAESLAPYPLFTKPANLGSSVGVSKCRNRSDLMEGLLDAARYDRRILVEVGVNAREIEISVLGNDEPQASVVGEIRPSDDFYSYQAKYIDDSSELIIPAQIPQELAERARAFAVQAYQAIDCAGLARVDFLLDKDNGALYLMEINTLPGFTSISMYPKLWEASGLPYAQLIDRLIELALERRAERERTEWRYQG